jgi:hypothetical protein
MPGAGSSCKTRRRFSKKFCDRSREFALQPEFELYFTR